MSAHMLLLDNLQHVASINGGVTRLRDLVLDLAVRGALVSPARDTDAVGIDSADVINAPHEIPDSWTWTRGSDVFSFVTSGSRGWARYYSSDGPIFVRIGNLDYRTISIDTSDVQHVSPPSNAEGVRTRVQPGDILISITGDTGMVGLAPAGFGEAYINQHIALARPRAGLHPPYIAWALAAPSTLGRVQQAQRGIKNSLGLDDIRDLAIPLPPFDEQKRIVAKIDQIMTHCDELEADRRKKREVGDRLTKAAFGALMSADTVVAVQDAWRRIAPNLRDLVDRTESAADLRKAVVELAVRGLLVEPHKDDGEAPDFASADQEPYPLPKGWRWSRLESISTDIVDCLHATPHYTSTGYPAIRTADVVPGKLLLERAKLVDERQYKDRIKRLVPAAGDIVYSREGERLGIAACVPPGVELCLSQRMMQIRVRPPLFSPFIMWAMNSQFVYAQAVADTGGSTSPHVNMKSIRRFLVPVAPVPMQRRIVARIEQFMTLCDALEARLRARDEKAARLAEALVAQILA